MPGQDPVPEIVVLYVAQPFVEWAEFPQDVHGHEQGAAIDGAVQQRQHRRLAILVERQMRLVPDFAGLVDKVEVGEEDRVPLSELIVILDLGRHFLGEMNVVVAKPSKDIAGHLRQRGIHCAADALVFLDDVPDLCAVPARHGVCGAAVGGAIIYNDYFNIIVRLPKRTIYRLRKKIGSIIDGNRYCDLRMHRDSLRRCLVEAPAHRLGQVRRLSIGVASGGDSVAFDPLSFQQPRGCLVR